MTRPVLSAIFVAFVLGLLGGATMLMTMVSGPPAQRAEQTLRPTTELLGEVTTIVPGGPNSQLAAEAAADDRLRELANKDAWQ